MSKRKILVYSLIIILLIAFSGNVRGIDLENTIIQAAEKGLPIFLESIPKNEITEYGFNSQEEMDQAELGAPFQIFTIQPKDLEKYGEINVSSILKETGEWYVPVLVNKEYRVLLTVSIINKTWQAVGISGARLAAEIGDFHTDFQKLKTQAGTVGETSIKFVRVFQAFSDLMFLQAGEQEFLFLFESARTSLEIPYKLFLAPQDILPQLASKVKENLK